MDDGFVALAPAQTSSRLGTAGACAALAVAAALVAGLALATADVRVTQERPAVTTDLATAGAAAAAVPTALVGEAPRVVGEAPRVVGEAPREGSARPGAEAGGTAFPGVCAEPCGVASLRRALEQVARSGRWADEESGGVRWWLAGHAGVDPGGVQRIRREAERMGRLADAARPLATALAVLDDGSTDPGRLDDLARGFSRYATATVRVNGPGTDALDRAAVATGLLTDLSGADHPRTWTLCPPPTPTPRPRTARTNAALSCTVLTVSRGRVAHRRHLRTSPLAAGVSSSSVTRKHARRVVIVWGGSAPSSESALFGDPEPGAAQRFDPLAVYRLLMTEPARVSAVDPEEQAAIARLAG